MSSCACGRERDSGDVECGDCRALRELGLAAGASLDDVKSAYKTLVKVWHPDRFQGDLKLAQAAEKKLKAINTAFSYLTAKGYAGGGAKSRAGERSGTGKGSYAGAAGQSQAGQSQAGQGRPVGRAGVGAAQRRRGTGFGRGLLVRLLILAVVAGTGAFLIGIADSYVANDTRVGRYYVDLKTQVRSEFEAAWQRATGGTMGELAAKAKGIFWGGRRSAPAAVAVVSGQAATAETPTPGRVSSADAGGQTAMKKGEGPLQLRPYVTVGLTRDEVVSAQGEPTSSTDDRLMYGASELDLKDGRVVGWKIDARSPVRVKLWPEGPVDTTLRTFEVGSTKDEVLVVQGTPSSFTEDRFEYGSSVVYFREGRVVVWKEGSVRLKAE